MGKPNRSHVVVTAMGKVCGGHRDRTIPRNYPTSWHRSMTSRLSRTVAISSFTVVCTVWSVGQVGGSCLRTGGGRSPHLGMWASILDTYPSPYLYTRRALPQPPLTGLLGIQSVGTLY